MLEGRELYEMWVGKMEYVSTDSFDSWNDLNIGVQQAWESLAEQVSTTVEKRLEKNDK